MKLTRRKYDGLKRKKLAEKTREKLLHSGLRLFVRHGYDGTSVRDIASDAGVTTSLLFHYFGTKQALLQELLRSAMAGVSSVVGQLSSADKPLETFYGIASMVLAALAHHEYRSLYLLVNQALSVESVTLLFKGTIDASLPIRASVPLIELGQRKGEFRSGDPLQLLVAFWGAIQGIAEVLAWNPKAPVPDPSILIGLLKK